MRAISNPVAIDKYALYNACLANETTMKEVSIMLGHSGNYLSQVFRKSGEISMGDYENLKGMLRVTDDSLIKAIPVQRADEVESIYSPRPVRKGKETFGLTEDNLAFVELLATISGGDRSNIINGIINDYRTNSSLAQSVGTVVEAIKELL